MSGVEVRLASLAVRGFDAIETEELLAALRRHLASLTGVGPKGHGLAGTYYVSPGSMRLESTADAEAIARRAARHIADQLGLPTDDLSEDRFEEVL